MVAPILDWRKLLPAPQPAPRHSRKAVLGPLCVHCQRYKRTRPRHLCRRCHSLPAVRKQYPPVSAWGRRTFDCAGPRRLPDTATTARPGTPEKIAVLTERARRRVALHHPGDAPMDPECDGWPSWWWEN